MKIAFDYIFSDRDELTRMADILSNLMGSHGPLTSAAQQWADELVAFELRGDLPSCRVHMPCLSTEQGAFYDAARVAAKALGPYVT